MSILDSLSLSSLTVILAVLVHTSGLAPLSPAPLVQAIMPEPEPLEQPALPETSDTSVTKDDVPAHDAIVRND